MKNLINKITAVMLVVCVILTLAGCKKSPKDLSSGQVVQGENKTKDYITLLYSAADSFNPYAAATNINRQLCKLLYEPLVKLDNNFEPINCLAESVATEGDSCTVKLKSAVFSDGSPVRAEDVVYSCNLALASQTIYAADLYEVASVRGEGQQTVVFKLKRSDPYFVNCLDFPILKANSDKITDSDSVLQPPIGCGRYKISADRKYLEQNPNYFGAQGGIKTVRLINSPDSDSVAHYIEIGATDLYYSEVSDGDIIRMSGNKLSLILNNLVYLGVNRNHPLLSDKILRQAISTAVDREKICAEAFYNNAVSANGFFNPYWKVTKSVQNIEINSNKQITVENLEKIGYNKLNGNGIRIDGGGRTLAFTLLVNSENRVKVAAAQLIAKQLRDCGIGITIIEKNYESYVSALTSGSFQLYLGEIKITDNMDFSPLIGVGGAAAYGLPSNVAALETHTEGQPAETLSETVDISSMVNDFYKGSYTVTDLAQAMQDQMPVIPLCYRTGVLFYNDNIENIDKALTGDIYFSIESYIYNDK